VIEFSNGFQENRCNCLWKDSLAREHQSVGRMDLKERVQKILLGILKIHSQNSFRVYVRWEGLGR
jgi:hypothetical protein